MKMSQRQLWQFIVLYVITDNQARLHQTWLKLISQASYRMCKPLCGTLSTTTTEDVQSIICWLKTYCLQIELYSTFMFKLIVTSKLSHLLPIYSAGHCKAPITNNNNNNTVALFSYPYRMHQCQLSIVHKWCTL